MTFGFGLMIIGLLDLIQTCTDVVERKHSPDLQTAQLQRHPITHFTGMILHIVTTHLM